MEISYYWIDNFSNIIKEQGYNLGSQLIFDFNYEQNEFKVKENKLYVEGFFNFDTNKRITNVTAIAGKNGVGKSTFLRAFKGLLIDGGILATKTEDDQIHYYKRILVIKIEDKYKVFFHKDLISSNKGSLNVTYENNELKSKYEIEFVSYGNGENMHNFRNKFLRVNGTEVLSSTACTYFSNAFDNNFYYDSTMLDRRYFDISTKGLLNEIEESFKSSNSFSTTDPNHLHRKDERFNVGLLKEFYITENKKRIKLISDKLGREIIEKHLFFPEKIYLNLDYLMYRQENFGFMDIDKSQLLRIEKDSEEINVIEKHIYQYIESTYRPITENKQQNSIILAKQTYLRRIVDSYFEDVDRLIFFKERLKLLKKEFEKVNEADLTNKDLLQLLDFFLQSTIKVLKGSPKANDLDKGFNEEHFKTLTNSYIKFIVFFDNILNTSSSLNFLKGNTEFVNTSSGVQSVGIRDICIVEISLNMEGIELLEEIIHEYESINTASNFIKIQWEGLSTGEDTLLSIYSRFFALKGSDLGEHIIILLDEIEHSLHPEWQRRILNNLIEYFPTIFCNCNSIQIILASNVPFLIADIPTKNVVYLEKSEAGVKGKVQVSNKPELINQTFAANIHSLLINNFFMESTIGEFSARKIQEIIKVLKSESKEEHHYSPQEINNIIQLIGEPIIKNKLETMYNKKFKEKTTESELNKIIDEFKEAQDYSPEKVNFLLNTILSKSNKDLKND